MQPYERILAWRLCHELNLLIAAETERWPKTERFELTAQLRRAAWSAAANIAEGSAKRGAREFRRYLDISLGSLAEISYGLRFALDRGILSPSEYETLESKRTEAARLTWGLYAKLSKSLNSQSLGSSPP